MYNSKEYIQLNSSFLGDGLARFIARVYVFYITKVSPKKVQWILMYVSFRLAALLISSFYPELVGYISLLNSAEFNIEALNNSFEANMAMLAGPADDVSSSNEWSANELILKASSADHGSTLGGNGSSENANSTDDSILNRKIKVENKMIEYQREQLMEIKNQLSTLQDESNLSKEQLEEKEALLQEKGEIERFIKKEVKEKIDLTKGKSSYNTSNISGSKRSGGDLNVGSSQKK